MDNNDSSPPINKIRIVFEKPELKSLFEQFDQLEAQDRVEVVDTAHRALKVTKNCIDRLESEAKAGRIAIGLLKKIRETVQ